MAKQERYAELADKIVELMGGTKNISYFTHCVTRLRFNVKDKGLVRKAAIEKLPGAIGTQWSGDQFQVIIGQSVGDVYEMVADKSGLERQTAVEEDLGDGVTPKKRFHVSMIFDAISGCITPLIKLLIAVGFIKIMVILGEQFGLLTPETPTDQVLTFIGDAGFYFLPVFIGASAARKFGADMSLGMLVGAMLIHPSFIELVSSGNPLNVFGLPIYPASYIYSMFPVILSVAIMAPVERFFAKHSPEVIRSVAEPFLTMLVMIPVTLCVVAPIGSFLGNYLSAAITWLYGQLGFVMVGVLACLYPLIITTGMHPAFDPYCLDRFSRGLGDPLVHTANIICNVNQGIAAFAVAFKSKDKDVKSLSISCGVTAILAGVTEPALFGVNMRYKTPLYAAMIGGLAGGCVAGFGGAAAQAMSVTCSLIAGLPVYISADVSNLLWMVAGVVVGAAVTFIVAIVLYRPEPDVDAEVDAAAGAALGSGR